MKRSKSSAVLIQENQELWVKSRALSDERLKLEERLRENLDTMMRLREEHFEALEGETTRTDVS